MNRLIVYRCGNYWLAHTIQTRRTGQGEVKEYSRIKVPQTRVEIEDFARQNGLEVVWDETTISAGPAD